MRRDVQSGEPLEHPREPVIQALDRVLACLSRVPGQRYCAPCLALALGLPDPDDVWRIMEMPATHRPATLALGHDECIGCHQARRTLSIERR
jgi:hypothetical protein